MHKHDWQQSKTLRERSTVDQFSMLFLRRGLLQNNRLCNSIQRYDSKACGHLTFTLYINVDRKWESQIFVMNVIIVSSASRMTGLSYWKSVYYYYHRISHFSASAGKHSPILGCVINRIRLDCLIYNLKGFLQLNMLQELQNCAFVYTYSDAD
jgi:hypothetical protein